MESDYVPKDIDPKEIQNLIQPINVPKPIYFTKKGIREKCVNCGIKFKEYKEIGMLNCSGHGFLCTNTNKCHNLLQSGKQGYTANCRKVDHASTHDKFYIMTRLELQKIMKTFGRLKKKNFENFDKESKIASDKQTGLILLRRDTLVSKDELIQNFKRYVHHEKMLQKRDNQKPL